MTQPVRVPDPVFERLTKAAEKQDVPPGVIVKQWMEIAEQNRLEQGP